jgi:DNA-binding protein YbaB
MKLDPEFLKEDVKLVEETILAAVQDAAAKAKAHNEAETQKITAAFQMPGMM